MMLNQSMGSDHSLGTMFKYSVEKPMAGAMIMYNGRNPIVNAKEPGIAKKGIALSDRDVWEWRRTMLTGNGVFCPKTGTDGINTPREAMGDRKFTYSDTSAAFPSTVKRTMRYRIVPHTQ
jgi:hypothetical protein